MTTSTDTPSRKTRIITLTDARPVKIYEDEWPVVAKASRHDGGQVESQANKRWTVVVREHDDGRRIVYGKFSTSWQGGRDAAGGAMIPALRNTNYQSPDCGRAIGPDNDATIKTIRMVADEVIDDTQLGDECIADLPPEEI